MPEDLPDKPRFSLLLVDDEEAIRSILKQTIEDETDYHVTTAAGGYQALQILARRSFSCVICDLSMPDLSGVSVLAHARERAPETSRVLLTGVNDRASLSQAVNRGEIHGFISKPVDMQGLIQVVDKAIERHIRAVAETTVIEETAAACVSAMLEMLAVLRPSAYRFARSVQTWATELADKLNVPRAWEIELAAQLLPVRWIAIPDDAIARAMKGNSTSTVERRDQQDLAQLGEATERILGSIPRIERVLDILRGQWIGPFSACPDTANHLSPAIEILASAMRLAQIEFQCGDRLRSIHLFLSRHSDAPPDIVGALREVSVAGPVEQARVLSLSELQPGMVTGSDLYTAAGQKLIPAGTILSVGTLARLHNFAKSHGLPDRIPVIVKD